VVIDASPPTANGGPGGLASPVAAQSLEALVAEGAGVGEADLTQRRTSAGAGDFATIIYTSGTTGRPKGCEITHGNLLANARNAVRGPLSVIFDTPGASTLLFLPLAHSFARLIEVAVIEAGGVLGHTSDVAHLLPELATFQPTFLLAVSRVFEKVYYGAAQQASESGIKGAIFHAAARTAIAWSSAFGTHDTASADGPGPRCGYSTPSSTGWSTASSAPRSAGGWGTRCPAVRRSETGSAISSAAPGSPSSRDTASPRPPPPPR
jgi:long-chain acyl-CoA synthetase